MGRTQSVYALSPNRIWTQGEHNRLRLSPPTSPNLLQVLSRAGGRLVNLKTKLRVCIGLSQNGNTNVLFHLFHVLQSGIARSNPPYPPD